MRLFLTRKVCMLDHGLHTKLTEMLKMKLEPSVFYDDLQPGSPLLNLYPTTKDVLRFYCSRMMHVIIVASGVGSPPGKIGKFLFPPKISHPQKPLNKGKYPIFLAPHSKNCQKFSVPPKIFGGDATMVS